MLIEEYVERYLLETEVIRNLLDRKVLARAVRLLETVRSDAGRLFILGVGGSAANASHAVNDFRKIAGIESYTPVDNVSELTARANDDGFDTVFVRWLVTSRVSERDALLVLSVGGGTDSTSRNLVLAMRKAKQAGAKIISIVSRDGGCARELSDACVRIPVVSEERTTAHAEGWQGIVWHLLVNAMGAPALPEAGLAATVARSPRPN